MLLAAAGFLLAVVVGLLIVVTRGEAGPDQPIAFSHKIHAGENQVPCLYCHTADRSRSAGVPAVATCMGCHKVTARNQPQVQKLAAYWDRKEPIPWVRVHNLPDHVQFTHEPHIRAGIECAACHGPVETMDVVRQVESLKMGWCIKCHERDEASTDCATCHY